MTTQEIREMLDSTITANGQRAISGQSLNAALHAILDLVEEGGSGLKGGAITVLLPKDDTFDTDIESQELLENNKACFEALKNQTEPMLIFLKYLGATKPLSQVALRLRHLFERGEGDTFFAFGYPATYSNEHIIGGLALASDMYMIEADGTTKKINYDGYPNVPITPDKLSREYHVKADAVAGVLGSSNARIEFTSDTLVTIYNVTGFSGDNRSDCVFNKDARTITIPSGWVSSGFGRVDTEIVFHITNDEQGNVLLRCNDVIVTAAGNIEGLTYEAF
jgi:hypothetical protein